MAERDTNNGNGFHISGAAGWYFTRDEAEREVRWILNSNRWSGTYPRIVPAGSIASRVEAARKA